MKAALNGLDDGHILVGERTVAIALTRFVDRIAGEGEPLGHWRVLSIAVGRNENTESSADPGMTLKVVVGHNHHHSVRLLAASLATG